MLTSHLTNLGSRINFGDVWQGCRRSLRLAGKCKVSAVCFSFRDENVPLGVDALAHLWPNVLLCIPTAESNFSHPGQSKRKLMIYPSDSPSLAGEAVAGRDCPAGPALSDTLHWQIFYPHPEQVYLCVYAHEGLNLNTFGLPQKVINTIQSARAPSTVWP